MVRFIFENDPKFSKKLDSLQKLIDYSPPHGNFSLKISPNFPHF